MKTAELVARLGCANNALHRLAERGVLFPAGRLGKGGALWWDADEQRAAAAVVSFTRSHLMGTGKKSSTAAEALTDALRTIAEAARAPLPDGVAVRWLILFADGSCARAGDWLAAHATGHRTLIPLPEIPTKDLAEDADAL